MEYVNAVNDALEIITDYQEASSKTKNTLEYHATVNPHEVLKKVKERLENVR